MFSWSERLRNSALEPWTTLPDPSLKQKITVALQPNAGLQERLEGIALPVQAVDNIST